MSKIKNRMLILILTLIASCNMTNKKVQKQSYSANIENFIDFELRDSLGNNLLKSNFTIDVIYYDNKGKEHIYFDQDKHASKGYIIINNEYVRLFLILPDFEKEISETYVRFNKGSVDIFKTKFDINTTKTNIVKDKVWFNDKLIWDKDSNKRVILPPHQINL